MQRTVAFRLFTLATTVIMVWTLFATPARVRAATFAVTNLNDSGTGSLRDAILQANGTVGSDIIDATGVSGVINLASALPALADNVTINGPGAANLTIRRNTGGNYSVIFVNLSVTATISDVTLQNGLAPVSGGGIENHGTLTLQNDVISGNSALVSGGGIVNSSVITVLNCQIVNNSAPSGGGIYEQGDYFSVNNSLIANNTATDGGGAYAAATRTLGITNTTISGNSASSRGGGLFAVGLIDLQTSTVAGNQANTGGGYYETGLSGLIINSTFANNLATIDGSSIFGAPTVIASTLYNSSSVSSFFVTSFVVTMFNSLLAKGGTGPDCAGQSFSSSGNNLDQDGTCNLTAVGDISNVNPLLDPAGLQSNGGPTQTVALQFSSPALNVIPTASCYVVVDQRGIARPQGPACDIGAFEGSLPQPTSTATSTSTVTATLTSTASPTVNPTATTTVTTSPTSSTTTTATSTLTATSTATILSTATETATPTSTTTGSPSATMSATSTPSATATAGPSPTSTSTATATMTGNPPSPVGTPANSSPPGPNISISDPSITKDADPLLAIPGEHVTFTIHVTNPGGLVATGIVVKDHIPEPLDVISVATSQGTFVHRGNDLTFDIGTVGPGQVVTLTIVTRIPSTTQTPADVVNTATLTSAEGFSREASVSVRITRGELPTTGESPVTHLLPGLWGLLVMIILSGGLIYLRQKFTRDHRRDP